MKLSDYFSVLILFFGLVQGGCSTHSEEKLRSVGYENSARRKDKGFKYVISTPVCNDSAISGWYKGVEFIDEEYVAKLNLTGRDIAHNYSNVMSRYVGNHLKTLYRLGKYSKVDLAHIRMTTRGMGDGDDFVEYRVDIPLLRVSKDLAMTGFDHSGGWGHPPDLKQRVRDLLKGKIVKFKKLNISTLYQTPEGLEEYWIQWQHADFQ